MALTKKNTLPLNHPNRNIMVTDLFDDFVKGGAGDMNAFINRKLDI